MHVLVDQARSQHRALQVRATKAWEPHIQIRTHRGHASASDQNVNDAYGFRAPDLSVLNEVHSELGEKLKDNHQDKASEHWNRVALCQLNGAHLGEGRHREQHA